MSDVPFLQHTPLFSPEQWFALQPALKAGFRELCDSEVEATLLQSTAAFLRWFAPTAPADCRLFLGGNSFPQIACQDAAGNLIEIQIMQDRFVWYVDGVADSVDVF